MTNRSTNAPAGSSTTTISPFATAAPAAETAMTGRGPNRSAMPNTVDTTAPATNPNWRMITSAEPSLVDSSHRSRSVGSTAEVENHVVIASITPTASHSRTRRRARRCGSGAAATSKRREPCHPRRASVAPGSADRGTVDHTGPMSRGRLLTLETLPFYIGGFLGPFGTMLVIAIYPELRGTFDVGTDTITWSFSGYLFPMAALLLVSGTIGERYGRFRVTRAVFIAYAIASVVAALAPTIEVFLAARVAQGIGNAFITPLLLAGLMEITPAESSGRAVGIYTAFQAAGTTSAPLVTGLLATVDWRWAFWLVAVISALLAVRPAPGAPRPGSLAPPIRPLLTLRMASLWFGAFFAAAGPIGVAVLVGVYLRDVLDIGSVGAGVILGIGGATTALVIPTGGDVLDRWGPTRTLAIAVSVVMAAIVLIGQITSIPVLVVVLIVTSAAVAFIQVTMQQLGAIAVPENRGGAVSSMLSFRFAGHAIGPLVLVPLVDGDAGWAFAIAAALGVLVFAGFAGSVRRAG